MTKVISVIRKSQTNQLNSDVISLETGAHYNNGRKFFEFSTILDQNSLQRDVFEQCDLIQMCDSFMKKGQNCNVMVYGPTNSGKTYTMLGS
jgi:polynucleotide 5'-kinase involved in rRNA processing